ncbi:MAG: nuclear transport factor 2 family protein [Cyclobacteriaceae bacterium]
MTKNIRITIILSLISVYSFAQVHANDQEIMEKIRALEYAEVKAVLEKDKETLTKQWATDLIVNNPANSIIVGRDNILQRMDEGYIVYSLFERVIERITVKDNMVIVMGQETVVPDGKNPASGKKLHRRYTNIWMQVDGHWQLTARQASIICSNQ